MLKLNAIFADAYAGILSVEDLPIMQKIEFNFETMLYFLETWKWNQIGRAIVSYRRWHFSLVFKTGLTYGQSRDHYNFLDRLVTSVLQLWGLNSFK